MTVAAPERRVAVRRKPAVGTVYRFDGPPGLGLIWNISKTGISMFLSEPAAVGDHLAGWLEVEEGDDMLRVGLRVVHARRIETGDYFVGAAFDRPLSAAEVRPFVAAEVED
ncbi:MAG: PilZ domain-containing protein [Gemmataceae bacterium]|nr:PilZ domain-containing protein [Gemmataceae bacterium]